MYNLLRRVKSCTVCKEIFAPFYFRPFRERGRISARANLTLDKVFSFFFNMTPLYNTVVYNTVVYGANLRPVN